MSTHTTCFEVGLKWSLCIKKICEQKKHEPMRIMKGGKKNNRVVTFETVKKVNVFHTVPVVFFLRTKKHF